MYQENEFDSILKPEDFGFEAILKTFLRCT